MSSVASSGILGQYEKSLSAASGGTSDRVGNDKDTFLKLLIAQLTHQDPLNPAEDKEFIAQLAQFTSVEELQKINTGIESLAAAQAKQQVVNASSLLGHQIVAKGDLITRRDDYVGQLWADFPEAAANCTFNVYTTNKDGSIGHLVRSEKVGNVPAGEQPIVWDGRDNNGLAVQNGGYIITISAQRSDGSSILVQTESEGAVIGVKTSPDGNHYMYLEDGRTVRFNDIQVITIPVQQPEKEKPEEEKPTEEGTKPEEEETTP